MIRAVIFDKDGVILNTELFNVEAGVRAFREMGIELDENDKKIIRGRHPIDYNKILASKYKFNNEKLIKRQVKIYLELYKGAKIFEGAKELVFRLKKKGFVLSLVTSAEKEEVNDLLKRFNFNNIFDAIITFEDCSKRKPAPDAYLLASEKLGVEKKDCLVIEDTPIGVESAKRAGMKCAAVTNTFSREELKEADYIINNLNEFKYKWLL